MKSGLNQVVPIVKVDGEWCFVDTCYPIASNLDAIGIQEFRVSEGRGGESRQLRE